MTRGRAVKKMWTLGATQWLLDAIGADLMCVPNLKFPRSSYIHTTHSAGVRDALDSPRALRPRSRRPDVRTRATAASLYFLPFCLRLFCCYAIAYRVM